MASSSPAPPSSVHVALCQMSVDPDKGTNIARASHAIRDAASRGAQLIVLPEMWNCPYANDSFPIYAEENVAEPGVGGSPSIQALAHLASDLQVTIVGGSIPERHGDALYNTCVVLGPTGNVLAQHRKTHLFDIDIPGKITFRESDTLTRGPTGTIVDTPVGRLGIGICYDIRFPELAMIYAREGAQILIYPGAFNMTTGPLHWELLARARAVDNQAYVLMCSPARDERAGYVAWGHSTAVSPFGAILGTTDDTESTVHATLDLAEVDERRRNMPFDQQRRADLYQLKYTQEAFSVQNKG
jgi:omega-amidase